MVQTPRNKGRHNSCWKGRRTWRSASQHPNGRYTAELLQPTTNQPLPGTPCPYKLGQGYRPATHIYKATVYVKQYISTSAHCPPNPSICIESIRARAMYQNGSCCLQGQASNEGLSCNLRGCSASAGQFKWPQNNHSVHPHEPCPSIQN
jgi:hypothetical protein